MPLNQPGMKVLFVDAANPAWDCEVPWFKIAPDARKCKRCYSSNHSVKDCGLRRENVCSICGMGNHHRAVCMKQPGATQPPVLEKDRKDPETNRGAKRGALMEQSLRNTSTMEAAGIDALKDKINELKDQILSTPKEPVEKSPLQRAYEALMKSMTEREKVEFGPRANDHYSRGDIDGLDMLGHVISGQRCDVRRDRSFDVFESTFGVFYVNLTVLEIKKRYLIFFLIYVFCFLVILGVTSPYYSCSERLGYNFEDRRCHPLDPGYPEIRFWALIIELGLALLAFFRINLNRAHYVGELLVKHTLTFHEVGIVEAVAHDVNNRHPMFRYGKTLEAAHPMRAQHDLQFYIPVARPGLRGPYLFDWINNFLLWRLFSKKHAGCIQEAHDFWRPVPTHAIRGVVNISHQFSSDPRNHANELAMFFPNLGPSVEGRVFDVTRFDAFSSLPNIAASKTWDDMCRSVEIAVKTCNWTAENWRFYDSESPVSLTNLLAYRWLSTTYAARRVLRRDSKWAF